MKTFTSLFRSLACALLLSLSFQALAVDFKLANANPNTGDGGYLADYVWASDPDLGAYWQSITLIGTDRSAWMSRDTPWGSPIANTTSFGASFAQAANLSFDWFYTSLDSDLAADAAGYILNGVVHSLSSASSATASGHVSLSLAAGDSFSWYVSSTDMLGGRATLALRNVLISAVPEPAPALMLLAGAGLLALVARRRLNTR